MFSKLQSLLRQYWGYDDFRGIQREIIESICSGHDTLGLMPTGGGKSITFQVPALALEGTCVVITPLIALMKDQVQNLCSRGIRAAAIYSGLHREAIITILENAVFGHVRILYVSPERLSSELFRTKLRHVKVSFICVDEAHCISQWGYDFRPSYLHIADIRRDLPGVPVLALTATATAAVIADIQDKLAVTPGGRPSFNVFRMSFERTNLAYIVRHASDKRDELLHILDNVPGSAIVYVRSRRRSKEVSDLLNTRLAASSSPPATFYHAGLDNPTKDERQQAWQRGEKRIIVATNAFGMGIDKPDVRLVVHIDCPDSIEAYFQEAGRAGRDGQKSYAVLLYNDSDQRKLMKRIADTFPEKDYIRQVYDHLAYYYQVATGSGYHAMFEFNIDDFCHKFLHFPVQVLSALQILHRAGYIEYIEEQESQARVMFLLDRDDLYRLDHLDGDEERVVTSLLRNYGGLFVDLVYIDEPFIAHETGLSMPQLYLLMKQLAMKHIIRFIPQKRTPYVRYLQRREDSEHLLFPADVYGDLKQRYKERIHAMLDYVQSDTRCRSRLLLKYFGEQSDHNCGQCDICLEHSGGLTSGEKRNEACDAISHLLADHGRHHVTELQKLHMPYEQVDDALGYMMAEEMVYQEDGFLFLAKK